MEKLLAFFSSDSAFVTSTFNLPPQLDITRQEKFRNKLKENVTMLRASIFGLESVNERDRFGNNPALATERDKHLQDSSLVLTYCQTDLFPTVLALYNHLLTKADASDLIPLLRDILPEEQPDARRRSGGNETIARSQSRDSEISFQQARSEGASVDIISVGRDLLEKIRKHQSKLDAYVNGYIKSREQWVQCSETRTKLSDGKEKRQDIYSREYWNKVKSQLGKIKMTEIVPAVLAEEFKQDDIFKASLGRAFEEVEKVSKSPDSFRPAEIESAIDNALSEMDEAITAADLIATECRENARVILGKIDELIDEIFKHNKNISEAIGTSATSAPPRQPQTESIPAVEFRESPPSTQSRQVSGN
ncbi:MAG: hypothetical protein HRF47_07440 [Chloroflexota bacterium]